MISAIGRSSFGGYSGAALTRSIQPRCTPAACLTRPPIDSALTDGFDRA
jgi:hypothetical protein